MLTETGSQGCITGASVELCCDIGVLSNEVLILTMSLVFLTSPIWLVVLLCSWLQG